MSIQTDPEIPGHERARFLVNLWHIAMQKNIAFNANPTPENHEPLRIAREQAEQYEALVAADLDFATEQRTKAKQLRDVLVERYGVPPEVAR